MKGRKDGGRGRWWKGGIEKGENQRNGCRGGEREREREREMEEVGRREGKALFLATVKPSGLGVGLKGFA